MILIAKPDPIFLSILTATFVSANTVKLVDYYGRIEFELYNKSREV